MLINLDHICNRNPNKIMLDGNEKRRCMFRKFENLVSWKSVLHSDCGGKNEESNNIYRRFSVDYLYFHRLQLRGF